jgi:DNA mismatch endonuclease, patch repair protein
MDMSKENRSRTMSRIRSKETKCEISLRKALFSKGYRGYRKNIRVLGFEVDIVFSRKKVAVFCDSDFWHGKSVQLPKSNQEYWIPKLKRNAERDRLANQTLKVAGWKVIRLIDKAILEDPEREANKIIVLLSQEMTGLFDE